MIETSSPTFPGVVGWATDAAGAPPGTQPVHDPLAELLAAPWPLALVDHRARVWRASAAFVALAGAQSASELVGQGLTDLLDGMLVPGGCVQRDGRALLRLVRRGRDDLLLRVSPLPLGDPPAWFVEVLGPAQRLPGAASSAALFLRDDEEHGDGDHDDGHPDAAVMGALARVLADVGTAAQVCQAMVEELPFTVGADRGYVGLLGDDGRLRLVHGGDLAHDPRVASVSALLLQVVTTSAPTAVTTGPATGEPAVGPPTADASRTWLVLPLVADARPVGVWALRFSRPGRVTASGLAALEVLAGVCAQALRRAGRAERDDARALALQHALAPPAPPALPGLHIVSRYLPAGVGNAVGGDFFDVAPLRGDRVALILGDVAGHGPMAAAAMRQVVSTLRAYALDGHAPGDVVGCTNRALMSQPEPPFVTCCFGALELGTGRLRLVLAGHLPPLLLRCGGRAEFVDASSGLPLGVLRDTPYAGTSLVLRRGDALLLYTDGLVESRKVGLDAGLDALRAAAQGLSADDPTAVDALVRSVRPGDSHDDLALLLVRYDGPPSG